MSSQFADSFEYNKICIKFCHLFVFKVCSKILWHLFSTDLTIWIVNWHRVSRICSSCLISTASLSNCSARADTAWFLSSICCLIIWTDSVGTRMRPHFMSIYWHFYSNFQSIDILLTFYWLNKWIYIYTYIIGIK